MTCQITVCIYFGAVHHEPVTLFDLHNDMKFQHHLIRLISAAALAAVVLSAPLARAQDTNAPRKILFFSKSSGYEHDMIKRHNGELSIVEKIMIDLGRKNNFDVTCTKDGRLFTPETFSNYDAFIFYTSGDLTLPSQEKSPPMTKEGKAAFLQAIASGKGFIGFHSASDTFHSQGADLDPYIKMIGGEFVTHDGWIPVHQICEDKAFPGMSAVPDTYAPVDEWYSMKNFAPDLHVLLAIDTASAHNMPPYKRPNYPGTWAHKYGQGRVFYSCMGHVESVWNDPTFQQIIVGAMNWTTGRVDADVTPNIDQVTPGAGVAR
jgi:type 1 glutamine amidotransferase